MTHKIFSQSRPNRVKTKIYKKKQQQQLLFDLKKINFHTLKKSVATFHLFSYTFNELNMNYKTSIIPDNIFILLNSMPIGH